MHCRKKYDVSFLSAHAVVNIMNPPSEKDTVHPGLEVAAVAGAELIPCLLLEIARLLRMTNDEWLAFVRAVRVAHQSDRCKRLDLLLSFRLSFSDSLIGCKAVEQPCLVHVIDFIKRNSF